MEYIKKNLLEILYVSGTVMVFLSAIGGIALYFEIDLIGIAIGFAGCLEGLLIIAVATIVENLKETKEILKELLEMNKGGGENDGKEK